MKKLILFLLLLPSLLFAQDWQEARMSLGIVGGQTPASGTSWSCADADIHCESLDLNIAGTGSKYDTAFSDTPGSGGSINADAAHLGTFVCTDKGSEALTISKDGTNEAVYTRWDNGSGVAVWYTQFYIYISAEGLGDTEGAEVARLDTAAAAYCWYVSLRQASGNLFFRFTHYTGSAVIETDSTTITTGTWYGIRVFYDDNNASGIAIYIDYDMDGTFTQLSVSNTQTTTRTGQRIAFGTTGATTRTYTTQYANVKSDNTGFASACPQ